MVETKVIGFIPPIIGVDGEFNTFRLSLALSKSLSTGEQVFLMNTKTQTIFGRAEVTRIDTGALSELCERCAGDNHSEVDSDDKAGAPERMLKLVTKIYGPHIAQPHKKATAVYMKRIE
jgi:hypothetical protein